MNLARTALALTITGATAAAYAVQTVPKYDITNHYANPITNIIMFWRAPEQGYGPGSLLTNGDPGFNAPGGDQTTHLEDLEKPVAPTGLLMLGIYNGPTDGAGTEGVVQEHVVLFMDENTADSVNHIAWGTVFTHTLEENLLDWIHTVHTGTDAGEVNDAYNGIFDFVSGDADNIPSFSEPDGTMSAWLTPLPNGQATNGKIMMWSDGTEIGTFTATNAPVPEPASLAVLGVGALGFIRRRRRK